MRFSEASGSDEISWRQTKCQPAQSATTVRVLANIASASKEGMHLQGGCLLMSLSEGYD